MSLQLRVILGLIMFIYIPYTDAKESTSHTIFKTSITLAPHLTELVYSAGAGDSLIGVSAYSNYPEDVANKSIIGDAFHLNLELITQLAPDVILYWAGGTPQQTVDKLKSMNFNLMAIEINQLSDIPEAIKLIAKSLGTQPVKAADEFMTNLKHLQQQEHEQQTALIQISDQPIFTVNGDHWMSKAIGVCGLNNVFADLDTPSAAVTMEAVILKKPEVIVRLEPMTDDKPLSKWTELPAIKQHRIAVLEADHFTRPTLRLLLAIESLCQQVKSF